MTAGQPAADPAASAADEGLAALVPRMQAFATRSFALDDATLAAMRLVPTDPAAALTALDAVYAELDGMEATELGLNAAMGAHSMLSPAQCHEKWRSSRLSVLDSRFIAATYLARPDETARTADMARAAIAGVPDHPYHATILEHEAEISSDIADVEQKMDAAFALRQAGGEFLAAARNRMRAAALAGPARRLTRLRACAAQALAVAQDHDLRREAVSFRIQTFSMLLISDQAGLARQAMRAELDFAGELEGKLADALEQSYAAGLASLTPATRDAAIATAAAFGLSVHAIRDAVDPASLATALVEASAELAAQRDGQRLELLLLAAQFKGRLGDYDTPVQDILPLALALATAPEDRCRVWSAMADARQGLGDLPGAIEAAEKAVAAARGVVSAVTRAQAAATLQALRQEAVPADPALDPDDYVARAIPAATAALQAGQPARALDQLRDLLKRARAPAMQGQLRTMCGVAQFELTRVAEAEAELAAAAALFGPLVAADTSGEGDLLAQRETALLLRAVALTRLGRPVEAWQCAEQARSLLLRQALGVTLPEWEVTRATLAKHKAAVLSVSALRWGTLVLSAAPGEAEPQALLLEDFHGRDVNQWMDAELGDDSDAWTAVLMTAAVKLSPLLMPPLRDRLRALAASAEVLYLIPDSSLYHLPWAAMEVEPGRCLAELMPFSVLPFAALLTAAPQADPPAARPAAPPAAWRSALALAFGKDNQGYDFTGHLDLLAPVWQRLAVAALAEGAATPAALQQGAAGHDIVYVSSHGLLDHTIEDVALASSLVLAGRNLGAGELGRWCMGPGLSAPGLAFLSACQSGRFRPLTRSEMGGFPAAFLRAGRRTLVAPLTHVDPHAAGAMAVAFIAALLGGESVAQALRSARLTVKQTGAPPADWAAHMMFGLDSAG